MCKKITKSKIVLLLDKAIFIIKIWFQITTKTLKQNYLSEGNLAAYF
jgi:hypothetical protein